MKAHDGREGAGVIEAYEENAERLADLLLEQLEGLDGSEHEQAYILALVTERLVHRASELGEVIEFEARDLNDRSALQMATALQAQCASLRSILDRIAADPRFGLLPGGDGVHPAPRPPTRLRPKAGRSDNGPEQPSPN